MTKDQSIRRRMGQVMLLAAVVAWPATAAAQHPGGRVPVRDPNHIFMKKVWSWEEIKNRNIVMQKRDYSCGAAALATMCKYYLDDPVTEDYILKELDTLLTQEEILDRIKNGLSLSDLRRVSDKIGYETVVTELTFDKLAEAKVPLLVGIEEDDFKHFIVYRGTNYRWVYLADPARGNLRYTPNQFMRVWQKNLALAISKPNEDVPKFHRLSLTHSDYFWGETSDQVLRTQPQRQSIHQPPAIR